MDCRIDPEFKLLSSVLKFNAILNVFDEMLEFFVQKQNGNFLDFRNFRNTPIRSSNANRQIISK